MASTFMPHPRTATTAICSTSSLLLLKFTLSRLIHFYCCKRLLGRNNTATTSAPHQRCQHFLRGALLLSCNVTNSPLFLLFFWSPFVMHFSQPILLAKSLVWGTTPWETFILFSSIKSSGTYNFHTTSCYSSSSAPLLKTFTPSTANFGPQMVKRTKTKIYLIN